MAFVSSGIPPEEQNKQAQQGVTTPNPLAQLPPNAGPGSGSAGQGGGGTNQAGLGTPTQFGSPASKLSDYLAANAPQVAQEGQNIAGNLNTQFGQTQSDIGQAGQAFGSQVAGGYAPPNQDVVNQAAANPTDFAANPSNVAAFKSQLNDTYSGPANFEGTQGYANVQNEVNNAVQNAGLLNSPAGLSTYLRNNVEANPTPGENTLDTVLLQGNPQAIGQVQGAASQFPSLSGYLGNTVTGADQTVVDAQNAAKQAAGAANTAFNGPAGVVPTFNAGVQSELDAANAARGPAANALTAENTDISSRLGNKQNLTPQELTDLGLTGSQIQSLIDTENNLGNAKVTEGLRQIPFNQPIPNLSQWLTPGTPSQISPALGTVATPADYTKEAALSKLLGASVGPLDQSQANLAGTYAPAQTNPTYNDQAAIDALNSLLSTPGLSLAPTAPTQETGMGGPITPGVPHPGGGVGIGGQAGPIAGTPQPSTPPAGGGVIIGPNGEQTPTNLPIGTPLPGGGYVINPTLLR